MPDLSVIICTYDRYPVLQEALETLITKGRPALGRHEVIVVDNTPAAKRRPIPNPMPDVIRVVTCNTTGLSHARNTGIQTSTSPVIAFLDDDAFVTEGWCDAVTDTFRTHPKVRVAGGRVLPRYDSPELPHWYDAKRLSGYLSCVDWGAAGRFLRRGEWIVGANMAWRRDVFDEFGTFKTELGRKGAASLLSNDEIDLLERIGIENIWYEPAFTVEHLVAVERMTLPFFRRRVFWQAVSDMVAGIAETDPDRLRAEYADTVLRLPAEHRNLSALNFDPADADQFCLQLRAIYSAALMMGQGIAPTP
jgi:glycosyltransferase involved in cell wall biosynthesis